MNFTKRILTIVLLFTIQIINSQTNTFITSNIQQHLLNKFWSSKLNDSNKVVFYFTQNQISVYSNGKKLADDQYYISDINCNNSTIFDTVKIGSLSAGNYIKTNLSCFIIEFYEDLQKFRIKRTYENEAKWQTFYLLNNPILQN